MSNNAQSSTLHPPSALRFPRRPGETPRAFSAFMAFFQLGHARSHQAVAETLGESLGTVRNWSSRFNWAERLQDYNSGLLEQQAHLQAENELHHVADWNRRLEECRELEWDASQKLVAAARCFLESFGDEDLRRMTLSQVSRALRIASIMSRAAILGAELPASPDATLSPLQQQLLAGLTRLYGQSDARNT